MSETVLKPNRKSYLYTSLFRTAIFLIIVLSVFYFIYPWLAQTSFGQVVLTFLPFLEEFRLPSLIIIFSALMAYSYISTSISYRKEEYTIRPNKIIQHKGGVFSDHEAELNVKNITHVSKVKPFFSCKLFGTGSMIIESAGSGRSEIFLVHMLHSEQIYNLIADLMRDNGFKMTQSELLQHESPTKLGSVLSAFQSFFSILFVLGLFSAVLTPLLMVFKHNMAIIPFLLIAVGFNSGLRYFDMKNRDYYIYNDMVIYDEGFLTRVNSFMPTENLADSNLNQSFLEKIFDLYDVKISCQGGGGEILFKNMKNGQAIEEKVDQIVEESHKLKTRTQQTEVEQRGKQKYEKKRTDRSSGFTSTFKRDLKRTVWPIIMFTVLIDVSFIGFELLSPINLASVFSSSFNLPVLYLSLLIPFNGFMIFLTIFAYINYRFRTYQIKKNSVFEKFNFISRSETEFSNDKVTGFIWRNRPVDRLFETFSLEFWSVGSLTDMVFSNLAQPRQLIDRLRNKFGFDRAELLYQIDSDFSVGTFLLATLPVTVIVIPVLAYLTKLALERTLFFVPVFLVLGAYIITILYKHIYYGRSKLKFYKEHVEFQIGIFFKKRFFVSYDDIKDIETTRYPFSSRGKIKFNVAGESFDSEGSSGNNDNTSSHSFTIHYVPEIQTKDELIDLIFYKRPSSQEIKNFTSRINTYTPEVIREEKPDLANKLSYSLGLVIALYIFVTFLFSGTNISIPIIPLNLLLFLPIPVITYLYVRSKVYLIEPFRVLSKRGILYKKQKSITFDKINYLNRSQNFLNKMFNNGDVSVQTIGSSKPELILNNMSEFKSFYKDLQSYY